MGKLYCIIVVLILYISAHHNVYTAEQITDADLRNRDRDSKKTTSAFDKRHVDRPTKKTTGGVESTYPKPTTTTSKPTTTTSKPTSYRPIMVIRKPPEWKYDHPRNIVTLVYPMKKGQLFTPNATHIKCTGLYIGESTVLTYETCKDKETIRYAGVIYGGHSNGSSGSLLFGSQENLGYIKIGPLVIFRDNGLDVVSYNIPIGTATDRFRYDNCKMLSTVYDKNSYDWYTITEFEIKLLYSKEGKQHDMKLIHGMTGKRTCIGLTGAVLICDNRAVGIAAHKPSQCTYLRKFISIPFYASKIQLQTNAHFRDGEETLEFIRKRSDTGNEVRVFSCSTSVLYNIVVIVLGVYASLYIYIF